MGQNALAVVYGVPMNASLALSLREDPSDEYSELDSVVEGFELGADCDCLGICVGTSIYAEKGEKELNGVIPLCELESFLSKQIKAAHKRWEKLAAKVLKRKQVELPSPRLMLVTVERA